MSDYTYAEIMKMQDEAVRRVEEMQKRAQAAVGNGVIKENSQKRRAEKSEPKRVPMPEGWLDSLKEYAKSKVKIEIIREIINRFYGIRNANIDRKKCDYIIYSNYETATIFKDNKPKIDFNTNVNADLIEYNCKADFIKNEKKIKDLEIKVNKEIPFAVNQIILKAMKKDPNERYQNTSEMIKDLNIALKRPEGGFVEERNFEDSFTRRIPTVNVSDNRNGNVKSDNEEEKPKGKIATFFYNHPKTKVASIIALFVLIFVATLVITLTVINSSSPKDVQIPNVVNLTQEEAKQRIEQLKLKFAYKEEYSADVEAGHVISQDPQYINNYSVKEGSTVTVVISKGMEQTKVPKVIGMEYSKAESALTEAGLEVEKVEETSQKVEAGYVISQEIDANTEVQKGTKIKIHVSTGTGIKKVTVTSVIGKSSEEAKKILTDLKLEVNVVEDEDTSKSDGVVLKQSVDPGTSVEEGSAITITVNKIEKNKQGTVNINVKALANRHLPKSSDEEDDNTTTTSNNVKITVMVGSDKVYSQKVSRDTEKLNVTVEGKGNITVKVYIANEDESSNGILAKNATIDLNSENTVLNVD